MEKEAKRECGLILDEVLPLDIIYNILERLTEKPLLRLKCVSKPSSTLVNDYAYTRFCHSIIVSSNTNRLLLFWVTKYSGPACKCGLYSYNLDSPESPSLEFPLPMKYRMGSVAVNISIIGSCNGILCLLLHLDDEVIILLINPTTMTFFELPKAPKFKNSAASEGYGFGYDCKKGDFKLVKIASAINIFTARKHTGMLVYSLKANSWRFGAEWVENRTMKPYFGVLIGDHLLHWTIWRSQVPGIACFDLCNEQWGEVPLPDYLQRRYRVPRVPKRRDIVNLGNLDGCLCLLTRHYGKFREYVDVWVMKEYDMRKSWVKLLGDSDKLVTRSLQAPPIAYNSREVNEILLSTRDHSRLQWYNLRDKSLRAAAVPNPLGRKFHIC